MSCTSMRNQVHPPQSSMEIPGTGSMRRKTAVKKTPGAVQLQQGLSQVGPFLLRIPRKAEKTFGL